MDLWTVFEKCATIFSMQLDFSQDISISKLGTLFFALAVAHTFSVPLFAKWMKKFPVGSVRRECFHCLAEIEMVFGIWAALFYITWAFFSGGKSVLEYHNQISFAEPIFVFGILLVAASKPILHLASTSIQVISSAMSRLLGLPIAISDFASILILGPLVGSLITEPAAMTVCALLLSRRLKNVSVWFGHFVLAVLFVNVSIGGALTPFAAPPILMVAGPWGWDLKTVFSNFGWKCIIAVFFNAVLFLILFQKKILHLRPDLDEVAQGPKMPKIIVVSHLLFLGAIVLSAHHPQFLLGILLFFLGFVMITHQFQAKLRLKESLLVAFFLAGIIVFGPFQKWWLEPVLAGLSPEVLFWGATALTAVTDNAALTFLGTQVPSLTEAGRYFLVAGAIAGGGLTVIANAPNAAGLAILQGHLSGGLNPGRLFLAAVYPTAIACLCLFFL